MYSGTEEADRKVIDKLAEVSARRSLPQATVALAWMLAKPHVDSPIVGATKPSHLEDAVRALQVKLSPEEIAELEAAYIPHPVLGFK
jgi:aryl-alcohol dehydrogenase-like predicted oxidoreductase